MRFGKGSRLIYKDGTPAYEKLDDEDFGLWVSLTSTYAVRKPDSEMVSKDGYLPSRYEARPESEKPLWLVDEKGHKTLNRYGWKWTDAQIFEHYGKWMDFDIK